MLIFWLVLSIIGMSLNVFSMVLAALKGNYAGAIFHLMLYLLTLYAFVVARAELKERRKNK